jgi:hypothetical protein
MDTMRMKSELDRLFAHVNPPHGIVPEWFNRPLNDIDIAEVLTRLGGGVPSEVIEISKVFSGLSHEVALVDPYSSKSDADESEEAIVSSIADVREWGGEELVSDKKAITLEGWDDIADDMIISFDKFRRSGIHDSSVILVGYMDHGEIYMDMEGATGAPAGSLLNIDYVYPECYVRIIAGSYRDFWEKIVRSLAGFVS